MGTSVQGDQLVINLPEAALGDEEMLEMIDLQAKAQYSLMRISEQVELGERDGYPRR